MEVARAERMRQNGHGTLTLEEACTWLEETGLCLFLPKRQFATSLAPSFVEAVAGQRNSTPDPRQIALAEDLLVRLEQQGVAVRLNLLGQPGEQPDYVVAAWVLPYVYALRGDRDWRRTPQLTGSRAVSPLAIQLYKRLEADGDASVSELKQSLGHGVSEMGVLRAITELWQQLRIIPVVAAPGKAAKWLLLRIRFQKAIAEGASTSQVTAISVLASIFLQAVIAASMEEVEMFLSPLTARSKIREVLRGLVATRQVHTLSLGHAPHFYVAGTLPEFTQAPTIYASSIGSAYLSQWNDSEDRHESSSAPVAVADQPSPRQDTGGNRVHGANSNGNGSKTRSQFARPSGHARERKPTASQDRRGSEGRASRTGAARPSSGRTGATRTGSGGNHWSGQASKNGSHAGNGHSPSRTAKANGTERNGTAKRTPKAANPSWKSRNGSHAPSGAKKSSAARPATTRKDARPAAHASRNGRKPALSAGTSGKRFSLAAKGTKKRG
ncbi:MAG TPA: hypothetical protein VFE01_05630 [Terracidiphilus sp.]|nr:hypothetical protein [Terracidiphilus sp.]